MIDPHTLLGGASVVGALALIGLIVYAETGFLLGLFLPGDTLLLVVGVFAAQGDLPLWWAMIIICVAAILGDSTGYYLGRTTGGRIFTRHKGLFFREEYVQRAETFYAKHGGKTIIIARFFGYARTIAPILAGAANMYYPKFITFNIIGAIVWTLFFVLLGYWVGIEAAHFIERYFVPSLIFGALIIIAPSLVFYIRGKIKSRKAARP